VDPRLDSEQEQLRRRAREVALEHVVPRAADIDAEAGYPAETVRALGEEGLLEDCVQPARQSTGERLLELVLVMEELGRASAGVAAAVVAHAALVARAVAARGDDEQHARWLGDLLEGRRPAALAAASSSILEDPGPTVEISGDGDVVTLSGEVPGIAGATGAELFLVPARGGGDLVGLYLVERGADGLEVEDGGRRLGLNGAGTGTLRLADVEVSASERLGPAGARADALAQLLDTGRLAHAAVSVGIAQAALDACLARTREADDEVARSQSVQWMLAARATESEAARLLTWYAADRGRPDERSEAAAMARLVACDAAVAASRRAVQVYGSRGGDRDLGVERLYRDAKAMEVHAGTSEAQRAAVARHLLPDLT